MTQLEHIVQYLDQELETFAFNDGSLNGLQVESSQREISKVAVSVDAGESILDQALSRGVQLLIVHHGIIWGNGGRLNGTYGRKIRKLIEGGCSLYVSHLPLDGHPRIGNNVLLANFFGFGNHQPFAFEGSKSIGCRSFSDKGFSLDELALQAKSLPGFHSSIALPFGTTSIRTAAFLSGAGAGKLLEASQVGADILITGEPRQSCYHDAKELGINFLAVGHYASECFGVEALGYELQGRFGLPFEFIHEPTGI